MSCDLQFTMTKFQNVAIEVMQKSEYSGATRDIKSTPIVPARVTGSSDHSFIPVRMPTFSPEACCTPASPAPELAIFLAELGQRLCRPLSIKFVKRVNTRCRH